MSASATQGGHKNRHMRTIAQICPAISSQIRHVLIIGKKTFKQLYLLHMPSQYGERRLTSGWDRLASFGHPTKFQRVSRLCFVKAKFHYTIWSEAGRRSAAS